MLRGDILLDFLYKLHSQDCEAMVLLPHNTYMYTEIFHFPHTMCVSYLDFEDNLNSQEPEQSDVPLHTIHNNNVP